MTDTTAKPSVENHTFEFSSDFLIHTVNSQSSTLAKAIMENVANSIDSASSRVEIVMTSTTMTISDDGHGFRTKEEVLQCFKVFGFDHTNHKREFGRFGLGRAQAWAYASARWFTHNFLFDIDIRNRGFNWQLGTEEPHVDGLRIEMTFYKPLTNVEMVEFRSELEKLVRYSEVPVILNGERLSKPPSESKWNVTTEEAYLRTTDGHYLAVYNQGIFVANLYSGTIGIAGTLVTKRGHNLTLNVSRNEIMRATCPVWAKLKPKIAELATKTKTKRLNDADRAYLAMQTADPANIDNFDKPIITLSNGKHVTLHDALKPAYYSELPLTVAEMGSRMGESLIRDKSAIVLGQVTLERFGVESVAALLQVWKERMQGADERLNWNAPRHLRASRELSSAYSALTSTHRTLVVYENLADCPGYKQLQSSKIKSSDLSAKQRLFLRCADVVHTTVAAAIRHHTDSTIKTRELILGRGDGIEAYTDGSSYIAIVDGVAEEVMKQGLPGFIRLAHIFVHEYLHDTEDTGSHAHDLQFMESFHDIVLDRGTEIFNAATYGFRLMMKETGKVTRREAKQLDQVASSEKATQANTTA